METTLHEVFCIILNSWKPQPQNAIKINLDAS